MDKNDVNSLFALIASSSRKVANSRLPVIERQNFIVEFSRFFSFSGVSNEVRSAVSKSRVLPCGRGVLPFVRGHPDRGRRARPDRQKPGGSQQGLVTNSILFC